MIGALAFWIRKRPKRPIFRQARTSVHAHPVCSNQMSISVFILQVENAQTDGTAFSTTFDFGAAQQPLKSIGQVISRETSAVFPRV